jgi:hypothetical protein
MTSILDRMRTGLPGDLAENPPFPLAPGAADPSREVSRGFPRDAAPPSRQPLPAGIPAAAPCPSCGSRLFWLTPYSSLLCTACQPPSSPSQVRRRLQVGPSGWIDADDAAEAAFAVGLPPAELCGTCGGNLFYLDYDGKIFCKTCVPPIQSPAKKLFVRGSPTLPFHWCDLAEQKFPTVREISSPEEIAYFDQQKKIAAERAEKLADDLAWKNLADEKKSRRRKK